MVNNEDHASKTRRKPQYIQNIIDTAPSCRISSAYADPLEDETLEDLASACATLDIEIIGIIYEILKSASKGSLTIDVESQSTIAKDREQIVNLQSQFKDIRMGRYRFSKLYLQDGYILKIWGRAESVLSQLLDDDHFLDTVHYIFRKFQESATLLTAGLEAAVTRGVLTSEDRAGIRLRFIRLDDLFDLYHRKTSTPRTAKRWPEIRDAINAIATSRPSTPSRAELTLLPKSSLSIFWATIAVTTGITLPTLYQAYRCSPHSPGTTHDADFWLLIQSSSMQTLGLGAAMVSAYKDSQLSRYARGWVLTMLSLGFCCVVGAVGLYTLVATEWSALINCMGGAVQAFVLVQVLISKKEKRD